MKNTKTLIPVLALVVAGAAFWFLALAPKRAEIAKIDGEISAKQAEVEQSQQLVASYERAKANYRVNYAKLASLGKAVPADDDVRSLIYQLDDAARRSNVDFRALNVGAADGASGGGNGSTAPAAAGTKAPPPGTVAIGSAGFSAMPFTLSFKGSYFNLSNFFTRLEKFVTVQNNKIDVTGRLLLLGSISVTPQTSQDGQSSDLVAQVGAATYLVPPTEGVDGAAAPTDPAAAGTAPAPSGTTPPTTTATITGAR
jgi:Tfp pilus assembly protein PilO